MTSPPARTLSHHQPRGTFSLSRSLSCVATAGVSPRWDAARNDIRTARQRTGRFRTHPAAFALRTQHGASETQVSRGSSVSCAAMPTPTPLRVHASATRSDPRAADLCGGALGGISRTFRVVLLHREAWLGLAAMRRAHVLLSSDRCTSVRVAQQSESSPSGTSALLITQRPAPP